MSKQTKKSFGGGCGVSKVKEKLRQEIKLMRDDWIKVQ